MDDAPLVYCRPDECSYCIALGRNLETALAELAALKAAELSEHRLAREEAEQELAALKDADTTGMVGEMVRLKAELKTALVMVKQRDAQMDDVVAELAARDRMLEWLVKEGVADEWEIGLARRRAGAKGLRCPRPGEVDAYMAEEHAKACVAPPNPRHFPGCLCRHCARAEEGGGDE